MIYKNDERIFIQDLVISFFAFLPFMVLIIGFIFIFAFYTLIILAHSLLYLLTCSRLRVFTSFHKKLKQIWRKIIQSGI